MSFHLDCLLDIPGITVETCSYVENSVWLQLRIVAEGITCPHCGNYTEEMHSSRQVLVRDLPSFGKPVYLRVPRRKFYCGHCQRYPTEVLEFVDKKRRQTQRYSLNIYHRVISSSIEQISREEELSVDEVKGIFDYVYNLKKKDWGEVTKISIDEVSKRKGHKDFVTVISDIERGELIEVLNTHKQEEIIESLKQQPLEARLGVKEVTVDMWGGFPKVVEEVFPNAILVYDRFHVMQLINKELNKLRKKIGVQGKYQKYLLLKNGEDLTEEQKTQLADILNQSGCLKIAYELKEEFREIYETSKTVKTGEKRFKKWLNCAGALYRESTTTIRKHLKGICNYFISRSTSGVMEGINNRIKLVKRQGYGFTNFDNFRSRLLACYLD